MSYTVEVTREDKQWIGDVLDLPGAHSYAGNLEALKVNIREVIGLVLDDPEDTVYDIAYTFPGVDPTFAEAIQLGEDRERVEQEQHEIAARTEQLVARLSSQGWSRRDIGSALHLTHGRVSQLLSAHAA